VQRHRRSRLSDSHHVRNRTSNKGLLHPKKVGSLPVEGSEEVKRTNEIKTAIPLLDAINTEGKEITTDALLTQKNIADYLVRDRHAHYHFTVKNKQPGLFKTSPFILKTERNLIFSAAIPLITAGSKSAKYGLQLNLMTISSSLMSDRLSSSNGKPQIRKGVNTPVKSP